MSWPAPPAMATGGRIPSAGGDSVAWLPYSVYLHYGGKQVLENQYECARRWLEVELACAREDNPMYSAAPQYELDENGKKDADYISTPVSIMVSETRLSASGRRLPRVMPVPGPLPPKNSG